MSITRVSQIKHRCPKCGMARRLKGSKRGARVNDARPPWDARPIVPWRANPNWLERWRIEFGA